MLGKSEIEKNLSELNAAFTSHPQYSLYFSKLAILELCGWTELCMDQVIRNHASRKALNASNIDYLEKTIIRKTYGFQYERHFRNMLMRLLGLVDLERLESAVDSATHAKMDAQLLSLNTVRNTLAHTFVQPTMISIDAPSLTISRLDDLYLGLSAYDVGLQSM